MAKNIPLFLTLTMILWMSDGLASSGKIHIVTPTELQDKRDLMILDCRSKAAFRQGRIPGSQHVDWKDWSQERADVFGLWFGKKEKCGLIRAPQEELQKDLRKLGISNSKLVVIVGEGGGWGEEGRVAWSLLYWGVDDVALLDGGFPAWARHHGNIQKEIGDVSAPEMGDFSFQLRPERRAVLDDVKKALSKKNRMIIDNRSSKEYEGKKFWGQKRGGHIPTASSLPVDFLYQDNGQFITKETLSKHISLNGHTEAPIAYCVGGVRSAIFAMMWEAYFGQIVANYDGSIWEWSNADELPLLKSSH